METVAHFTFAMAAGYLDAIDRHLKTRGVLVGTSAFPATRAEANEIASRNPHHAYIYTETEFLRLLRARYSSAVVIGGWMFIAIK